MANSLTHYVSTTWQFLYISIFVISTWRWASAMGYTDLEDREREAAWTAARRRPVEWHGARPLGVPSVMAGRAALQQSGDRAGC